MRAAAAAGESDGEKGGGEGGGGREGWPRVTRRPVDGEGGVEGKTEPKLATIRNAGAHGPHCPHSHPCARCRRLHEIHRSRLVYHSLFSSIHGGRPPQQVNGFEKVQHKQYNYRTDLPFVYSHRAAAHQYEFEYCWKCGSTTSGGGLPAALRSVTIVRCQVSTDAPRREVGGATPCVTVTR